ncbi:MAG: hypothetical protein CMJ65_14965 [Planctomycetaceae bacterium]|jgi:hypothetical protein|nr:hypothetical protein [Planctomycetaceae bacterium]MDP7277200.1 hypothetical protein [Planctomycetaceae bacterium]
MNKAFVKEAEFDGRAFCPQCGQLGIAVLGPTLDAHVQSEIRPAMGDSGWFCNFERCEVAYFNLFEESVTGDQLVGPVFPMDPRAAVCACFGLTMQDIEADVAEGHPGRIRELFERSQSDEARCQTAAADGRCCLQEVQRIYFRLLEAGGSG